MSDVTWMQLNRRNFMVGAGAAIGLASLPLPALAQASDTLRAAFSAASNRSLDPALILQSADTWIMVQLYDRLLVSPDGTSARSRDDFVPQVAESWTISPDSKVYTFKIRQGIEFHKDYGLLTAEDVAFSIQRQVDPDQPGSSKVLYANIADVAVQGADTVVVTLKSSDALFLNRTVQDLSCAIISKKAFDEKGENFAKDPVGSGPYQFESLDPDASKGIMLKAFDGYFGAKAKTPNLQILYMPDTTARTLALLAGDIHMMEGARLPGWVQSLQQRDSSLSFDITSPGSLYTMSFNLTKKPLDDLRVRQAIAYGIDRDLIAQAIAPASKRTYGVVPPDLFAGAFTAETVPPEYAYAFDPAKSKALLAEAGYPDGLALDVTVTQREDYKTMMLIMQDSLRQAGIELNLQVVDHTAFQTANKSDQNTLAMNGNAYSPVPTMPLADNLSKVTEVRSDGKGGNNYSHYGVVIPGIDDMLAAADQEGDLQKYTALIQDIEKKVAQDLPLIPVCTVGYIVARGSRMTLPFEVKSGSSYWRLDQATLS